MFALLEFVYSVDSTVCSYRIALWQWRSQGWGVAECDSCPAHQPEQSCLLITIELEKIMPILDVKSQLSPPQRVFSHTKDNGLYSYATALWITLGSILVPQYRCNDHFQSISSFPYFSISHFLVSRSPFYKYPSSS